MKVTIRKIVKKNKRKADLFINKEWKKFNKEKGYNYKEKYYEFIALDNKKIVGSTSIKLIGGTARLSQIIVSKQARRNRIGSLLLKHFEDFARKKKCHLAYLETSNVHKEALQFYKKNNYKIIAILKNHKFHFTWYILSKELKK